MEPYKIYDFEDEKAWLKGRLNGIGGSDASAVVGKNPYKTNIELFEEKTGRRIAPDISEKPYVIYGKEAEQFIRELFRLDYPQYQVTHHEFRILQSLEYPFMQASLDGELVDQDGRKGILEIKTTNILQSMQYEKWKDRIPDNYYIQILHYLLVTGYEFPYPALLAFGIPPVLSNTTNTVGVCGTGIGGLLSARKELKGQGRRVAVYACIGLVGGIIGGLLLLELPAKVFEFAVPPLILFSALIIALNPRKKAAARDAVAQALPQSQQGERAALIASRTANGSLRNDPWWLWVGVSFVGIYSGYFGAAAGTLALAILDLGKIGPFHQINALKTVVGFGANISAAIMFICRGSVYWPFAIAMCLGCIIGSSIAPPVTRHIPENIMRAAAVLTGIVLAVKLGCSTYF